MRIACIQPEVFQQKDKCYSELVRLFKDLTNDADKCEIACLPERWLPLDRDMSHNFQKERGSDYAFIKKLAKEYSINILSGAIWEKRKDSKKPSITCYFINEYGEEIGRQDKIHLYAYEKEQFEPGQQLNIFKFNNSSFAILICFDMAFFETPRLAADNGADVIFSPTQIRDEGMDNWNIYLQARALENRIPIAASNTFGYFFNRKYLGNSKIISFVKGFASPAKLKNVEAPTGSSGFVHDDVDLDFPRKIRSIRFKEKIEISKIDVKIISV